MKILLTGSNGQVGFELQKKLSALGEVIATDREELDLTDPDAIRQFIDQTKPDIIINPAAYTAVDKAELEYELAFAINALAPELMAKYAVTHNVSLMHYSTDYVFDGEGSDFYSEDRAVRPLGVYGKSKAEGERLIVDAFTQANNANACFAIFRTSWVYGEGGNFIRTILRLAKDRSELKVIADQFGVPTSADWLAALSADFLFDLSADSQILLRDFPSGIYHAVPAGETTWHGLACEAVKIARASGLSLATDVADIKAIPATEYSLPAPRPMNSRMSTQKLQKTLRDLGAVSKFPVWNELVRDYVSELVKKQLN